MIPVALSNKNGIASFSLTANDGQSSSLNELRDRVKKVWNPKRILVPVLRMDSFLRCLINDKIRKIEFVKIDAQGSDLDVIKGAGDDIHLIEWIQAEAQVGEKYYYSENSKSEMVKYLKEKGFHEVCSWCNGISNSYKL